MDSDGRITTIAGNGTTGSAGDGGPATAAQLDLPLELSVDPDAAVYVADVGGHRVRRIDAGGQIQTVAGNGSTFARLSGVALVGDGDVYAADTRNHRVLKLGQDGAVTAVAGTGEAGFSGDGGPAVSAQLRGPAGVTLADDGSLFIADTRNHRVRRIAPDGVITTVAGDGAPAFGGDGGLATAAQLFRPTAVAADADGALVIADSGNNRVRRVAPDGTITTVAGDGELESGGDGGVATAAQLQAPQDVALGDDGSIYVAEPHARRVRRVHPDGTISTVAGDGTKPADGVGGMAAAPDGSLYLSDHSAQMIRRVAPDGGVTTVAGTGQRGDTGDGGKATEATLAHPTGLALGADDTLFIADSRNNRVRRVGPDGVIETIAGMRGPGFSRNGPAKAAALSDPRGLAIGAGGELYVADVRNVRVRRIDPDGVITTVAGMSVRPSGYAGLGGFAGDGMPATTAQLDRPTSATVGPDGAVYIADPGNERVRRVGPDQVIATVAGTGDRGFAGDGGPGNEAQLASPSAVVAADDGSVYIADMGNHRVRRLTADGTIETVGGTGTPGSSGDGGPGTEARLTSPSALAIDHDGALLIAGRADGRVRRLGADGVMSTVATNGDGGTATTAQLKFPSRIAFREGVGLLIADTGDHRVRRVAPDGTISTLAGTGSGGFAGDGGPAVLARLRKPRGIAVSQDGIVFVADADNQVVRRIDEDGTISVAGSVLGDGGPATGAQIAAPRGLAVADDGALYVADSRNHRVRRVDPDGTIETYAGTGEAGFGGDGGPATDAQLSFPTALALDQDGGLLIADTRNLRVRRVDPDGTITTVAGTKARAPRVAEGVPATKVPVRQPVGLAVGPDGSLYVAEGSSGSVRRVGADGLVATVVWGVQPGGITSSADGELFVSDTIMENVYAVTLV